MSGMGNTIHVLHVDDDPSQSDLVATVLEREDDRITVLTATHTEGGREMLADHEVDCIVSDYEMPRMNGIAFLEAVREDYPDLPFILYTGKGSEEVASDAISAGVTDYLQKDGGTDQYTILANRVVNAVERYQAEREAERTRTQLQAISENSTDALIIIDAESRIRFANPAVEDHLGYAPAELHGRRLTTIMPQRYRERHLAAIDQYLETGKRSVDWTNVEFHGLHRDGSEVPLSVSYGEFQQDGEHRFIGIMRDISKRTRMEEELREREERFRQLAENITEVVWMSDPEKEEMIYANPAYEDIWGQSTDSLYDDPTAFLEAVHPEDRDRVTAALETQTSGEYDEEYRIIRPDGELRWVRDRAVPVTNDAGEVSRIIGIASDITERKEHERTRQQIIDRMNDAVIEVDPDWRLTLVNERAENLSGLDESELLGREFWDVFSDAQGTRFADEYRRAMETRESVSIVDYYAGLEEWFDITVYPNDDGGLAFYFRRITEYKVRERRLEQYARIVETMDDIAFVVDDEWNVEFTNESILEYVDVPLDSLEGQPVIRLADEYLAEENNPIRFEQALERAFDRERASGSPERLELTLDTDRGRVTFEYQFSPLVTDGETRAVVITMRDVTERKRHAEQLRALNERSRMLMAASTAEQIAEIGIEAAREVLELDASAVHLYDTEQSGLVPVAATDTVSELIGDPPVFTEGDGITWRAYERGEALAVDDVPNDPDVHNPETPIRSGLYFPLGDHGVLLAGSPTPDAFDEQDFVLGKILAANIASTLDQVMQTERLRRREAELQRQNDQLEEFARIVSHDLRNPLNVAEGRLELVAEECDSDHLDPMARALDRMAALIEDLLTLARDGAAVTDLERVDLTAIVDGCWTNVETGDATLVTTVDRTIYADESRLKQVFENLIRNAVEHSSTSPRSHARGDAVEHSSTSPRSHARGDAVEHGGDDVCVRIGELDDGFYVEDDGPGIPADDRNAVFDAGYSTQESGTGFGLRIVEQIVDAHDWEIHVTEGSEGGARFEITGVEFAAETSKNGER